MYNIDELNVRLLSELKDIAEKLEVKNFKKLAKQELIYKILDEQAVSPEKVQGIKKETSTETKEPVKKAEPKKK